jgi:hypothetical protein
MSDWPIGVETCDRCTGSAHRYRHGARGNCVRCNEILKHLQRVAAWDTSRPETLKGISDDGTVIESRQRTGKRYVKAGRLATDALTPEQFERFRAEHVRQLEARLDLLRRREQIRRHEVPVSGLDVEDKFKQILGRLHGVRRQNLTDYPQNANEVNDNFNDSQRRVLYALLEEIIEAPPQPIIDWARVWHRVYDAG